MVSAGQEPLLLLPGLACDSTIWTHQIGAIGRDRPVVVAGYGDAPSIADMADRALAMAPTRFALAGHSMGGRVALEVIDQAPDRVTRLALFDTGVHPPHPGEAAARQDLLDYGAAFGIAALVARWLPPMVHPDRLHDVAVMAPLTRMAKRFGLAGFERQVRALLGRRDATPLLARIDCPVMIGVGAQDSWSSPEQHRAFARLMKSATLVIFERSGHMAPFETPDLVNAALADWLALPLATSATA